MSWAFCVASTQRRCASLARCRSQMRVSCSSLGAGNSRWKTLPGDSSASCGVSAGVPVRRLVRGWSGSPIMRSRVTEACASRRSVASPGADTARALA
eukprot:6285954-Pyramimonas_sp.AAC.1